MSEIELSRINETSYLNADNAGRYRAIMRVFYHADERMRNSLYQEDVLGLLRDEFPFYQDLDLSLLKQDLAQLVTWGNLEAVQDPKHVYTIAEYKNKRFRYSITPAAVEVERMVWRLENLQLQSSSLSSNYFLRLENQLKDMDKIPSMNETKVNDWWKLLMGDFRSMYDNYRDYLREFYSGSGEKILKSVEFVIHKDRFVAYLRDFILQLQPHTDRIAALLRRVDEAQKKTMLERIVQCQLNIPHLQTSQNDSYENDLRAQVFASWDSLEHWFLEKNGQPSESLRILNVTNDIIEKIIQNAALIVQLQNHRLSRQSEYARWIDLFDHCASLEDAHCLSAFLFGAKETRHFATNDDRSTDSINVSTKEEEPFVYLLSSHSRTNKIRSERGVYTENRLFQQQRREEYLIRMQKNREEIHQYIHDHRLVISEIGDVISTDLRQMILGWITNANMSAEKRSHTEYGQRYRLLREEGECILHCEDGDLTMPRYILVFEGDE